MTVLHSEICEIGLVREINQDAILALSDNSLNKHLFVVADGMGGHSDGEYASSSIVESLEKCWEEIIHTEELLFSDAIDIIKRVIIKTNKEIYLKYENIALCGSTCIVMYIQNNNYGILSAGDSHIYKKNGIMVQSVMCDDVWENQKYIREAMSSEEIRNNPNRGKLTNAVGCRDNIELNLKTDIIRKKDAFLLCSDGLYKYCDKKELNNAVRRMNQNNIEETVNMLKEKVYHNGAGDNFSIIAVKICDKQN